MQQRTIENDERKIVHKMQGSSIIFDFWYPFFSEKGLWHSMDDFYLHCDCEKCFYYDAVELGFVLDR